MTELAFYPKGLIEGLHDTVQLFIGNILGQHFQVSFLRGFDGRYSQCDKSQEGERDDDFIFVWHRFSSDDPAAGMAASG
jgi:hypothetical protein